MTEKNRPADQTSIPRQRPDRTRPDPVNLYDLAKDIRFQHFFQAVLQWYADRRNYKLKDWFQTNWFSTGNVKIGTRRPWTPLRVVLHVLYWYFIAWRTNDGLFKRILIDPGHATDPALITLVQLQHFGTVIILFYVLGEFMLPKVVYREFSLRQVLSIALWTFFVYTMAYLSCRLVFLYIDNGQFAFIPRYVRIRVDLFRQSFWVGYTDPLITWFIWAHTFSYTFEPLLFKMGRDIHAWAHQFVRYEQELSDFKMRQVALEQENTRKELGLLRSQLHPHFLFNALNNIYALVRRTDRVAGQSVTNLADLMRYTLYRSQARLVTLEEEVSFLTKYIAIERLRRQDERQITTLITIKGYETWQLPPLLMVSFIENAIKHGLNRLDKGGYVSVTLSVETTGQLTESAHRLEIPTESMHTLCFRIENSMPAFTGHRPRDPDLALNIDPDTIPAGSYQPEKSGGIGLANTKRRLELLYNPGEWDLTVEQEQDKSRAVDLPYQEMVAEEMTRPLHQDSRPQDACWQDAGPVTMPLLDIFRVSLRIPLAPSVSASGPVPASQFPARTRQGQREGSEPGPGPVRLHEQVSIS